MSGLAHYLEREGLPTVALGLIPLHVSKIAPPRALVVPFELGRPFGAPDTIDLQIAVLVRALGLLERNDGPVLDKFGHKMETTPAGNWTPPIEPIPASETTEAGPTADDLKEEFVRLQPAYDQWVSGGGQRLDRISGRNPAEIVDLLIEFADNPSMESPMPGYGTPLAVKFAADDLKHAYYQAALARPDAVTDIEVDDWFFGATLAGRLLFTLRGKLLQAEDEAVRNFASHAFVPSHQSHRANGG